MEHPFDYPEDGPPEPAAAPDLGTVPASSATQDPIRQGLDRIIARRAELARLQGEEMQDLARLAQLTRAEVPSGADWAKNVELGQRSLIAELAVATRCSTRTMAGRLAHAELIVENYPATLAALTAGAIGSGHVGVISRYGSGLDAGTREQYENSVLPVAFRLTPGRLARIAQATANRLNPESFEDRHEAAAAGRSITVTTLEDGMSQVNHYLPTVLAVGIRDRLTAQAKSLKAAGDPRSLDQLRADLAAELLLTAEPGTGSGSPHGAAAGIKAEISIVMPVLTLLGLGTEPATLTGGQPIGLDDAKALTGRAPAFFRILTDPIDGQVLAVDRYRPSKKLRRYLMARDKRCRFPICTTDAHRCDVDHTIPAQQQGPTSSDNLSHLCRSHHTLKHHGGWTVTQIKPGTLQWTSPHGLTATDQPDALDDPPPPWEAPTADHD